MGERLHGQSEPLKIRNNDDHAALAEDVLWEFSRKTGLNRESESMQTVITDFLANLLHLCEQCDPDGAGIEGFHAPLNMAVMHYEQEKEVKAKNRSDWLSAPRCLSSGQPHKPYTPLGKWGGRKRLRRLDLPVGLY